MRERFSHQIISVEMHNGFPKSQVDDGRSPGGKFPQFVLLSGEKRTLMYGVTKGFTCSTLSEIIFNDPTFIVHVSEHRGGPGRSSSQRRVMLLDLESRGNPQRAFILEKFCLHHHH